MYVLKHLIFSFNKVYRIGYNIEIQGGSILKNGSYKKKNYR